MNRTSTEARAGRGGVPRLFIIVPVMLLAGCEQGPPRPGEQQRPEALPSPSSAPAAAPSANTSAAAAAPSTSAAPEAGTSSLQGTWEGRYEAKRGAVVMPPKVKDPVRQKKDDGKTGIGAGTVTLTIDPSGELHGTAKGALGAATLSGKADGDMISASVFPDDPRAPNAMTGILVGKMKDGVLHADLRVAGPDALLVRESPVELRKK